mmetsp:Transcript_22707/g.60356  ORF Transcript_22707/g.60356 Transcript_22707/m.60356 type:complete len:214 (-) Transcript_22707:53-694(-)
MEYIPGGTLTDTVAATAKNYRTPGLPLDHARSALREILEGLRYLHALGIAHRDIKTDNVLIRATTPPFGCVLADFGLSNFVPKQDSLYSAVGSPVYSSPELVHGGEYDVSVDVWATGVLFHFMLTQSYPFEGRSLGELGENICSDTEWEEELRRKLPFAMPGGIDLMRQMLRRDKKSRITAEDALEHPFFDEQPADGSLLEPRGEDAGWESPF